MPAESGVTNDLARTYVAEAGALGVQSRKAVFAYFTSKQILPFGFAEGKPTVPASDLSQRVIQDKSPRRPLLQDPATISTTTQKPSIHSCTSKIPQLSKGKW